MTTGKLAAWGPSFARLASFGGQALLRLAHRSAEGAKAGRPRQSVKERPEMLIAECELPRYFAICM